VTAITLPLDNKKHSILPYLTSEEVEYMKLYQEKLEKEMANDFCKLEPTPEEIKLTQSVEQTLKDSNDILNWFKLEEGASFMQTFRYHFKQCFTMHIFDGIAKDSETFKICSPDSIEKEIDHFVQIYGYDEVIKGKLITKLRKIMTTDEQADAQMSLNELKGISWPNYNLLDTENYDRLTIQAYVSSENTNIDRLIRILKKIVKSGRLLSNPLNWEWIEEKCI